MPKVNLIATKEIASLSDRDKDGGFNVATLIEPMSAGACNLMSLVSSDIPASIKSV